ncbi:MAG: DNA methylase domain-containing protein [Cenarchaeum symbiont of Oopsacas minuta]|nr:DNA methylase domain-containing protein [Cenarchaeum symbiont of Oopsacas minuta]
MQKVEWTFLDVSTRKYTHALHLYPARLHPEIARRIISKYAINKSDVVFDPFMGSGSVLLESILHGNTVIGIDINPFAVLLSKVKTTPIFKNMNNTLNRLLSKSARDHLDRNYHLECQPDDMDIANWFGDDTARILSILKYHVFKIMDKDVKDFFKICLSLTIRKSSYQRNGSWKIHRMLPTDQTTFKPQTIDIFKNIVTDNIVKMNNLVNSKPSAKAHVLCGDSRDISKNFSKLDSDVLCDDKAHLVVSSPPYGDHKTTVAYGQFSRFSSLWLDLPKERVLSVDKIGLGGKHKMFFDDLGSKTLNKTLDKVHKNDIKLTLNNKKPVRTKDVYSFFYDFDKCLNEISKNLIPDKSHCGFIVANRTVRRIVIPTDQILVELGKKYGFKVEQIIYRSIPNKSMPSKNAPENITNDIGKTMTRESVIMMRY